MNYNLVHDDAVKWARAYEARRQAENLPLFHALLCDPPYELKFMGRDWDATGVSFRSETWRAFKFIMHPGAFGMAFASARGFHRMAVAIEDAGFRIHPMIGWVYGSGFPKATRIKDNDAFEGHRYGLQALKPALEPIIVFQKPYKGKPLDSIVETGAGALNIDASRIGFAQIDDDRIGKNYVHRAKAGLEIGTQKDNLSGTKQQLHSSKGRWPANLVLTHHPDCRVIGYQDDDYQINRFTDGAKPFGNGAGYEFTSEPIEGISIVWECVEGCPARAMDEQSGQLKSGDKGGASRFFHQSEWALEQVDPFLYQAKAAKKERNVGLEKFPTKRTGAIEARNRESGKGQFEGKTPMGQNAHPTVKPIALARHLASLLLPPDSYAPRNLFIPFAGVASEMIGAFQAGWDEIVGVELEKEYIEIGNARMEYWIKQGFQSNIMETK